MINTDNLHILPFLKHADIRKQYEIPAVTYSVNIAISTVGSEYRKTAPPGHSNVMKNTKINSGMIHTTKLFRYHALACNQLSKPISIIASCKIKIILVHIASFYMSYIIFRQRCNTYEK